MLRNAVWGFTMQVEFRECDFFNLWIWLKFETVPSTMEQQYIDEVFSSWFFLGKLGGFNAENLQVQDTGLDISYLPYNEEQLNNSMLSVMHNMGEVEYEGLWARCWIDLGTSDALAIDVLINTLEQFNREYVVIETCCIGGENSDWPIPGSGQPEFVDEDA
jgi:Protein of unknown function (DUF3531)